MFLFCLLSTATLLCFSVDEATLTVWLVFSVMMCSGNEDYIYLPFLCRLTLGGPVTVGMSLDIASIDTISEINMVRNTAQPHNT